MSGIELVALKSLLPIRVRRYDLLHRHREHGLFLGVPRRPRELPLVQLDLHLLHLDLRVPLRPLLFSLLFQRQL